jgi:hypothetical protein
MTAGAQCLGIKLSERQITALAALDRLIAPATGRWLAVTMCEDGRDTSPAAAHQAGAYLTRAGLADKISVGYGSGAPVAYEITGLGRQWLGEYHRKGGRP